MPSLVDLALPLLQLANSPGGQDILRGLLERPDTPVAQLEKNLSEIQHADWTPIDSSTDKSKGK